MVTFRGEFPANITPWQRAAKAFGITVVLLEQPNPVSLDPVGEVLDQIQLELARGAKCVAVSAVHFGDKG